MLKSRSIKGLHFNQSLRDKYINLQNSSEKENFYEEQSKYWTLRGVSVENIKKIHN